MNQAPQRNGKKRLAVGILCLLLGLIVIPSITTYRLVKSNTEHSIPDFIVPGEVDFNLTKPGAYTIWHCNQTIFEGHSYSQEPGLPDGWGLTLSDAQGQPIPLIGDDSKSISSGGSQSHITRKSLLKFEIEQTGSYSLAVEGEGENRVLRIEPSFELADIGKVMGVVFFSLFLVGVGLGIGIWGLVVMNKSRKIAAPV